MTRTDRREDDGDVPAGAPGRRVTIAGLPLEICTLRQAVDGIFALVGGEGNHLVATVNVDQCLHVLDNAEVHTAFLAARLRFCDGAPLVMLSRLLGVGLPSRVTGADLLPSLCALASRDARRVLFLGGAEGVPQEAARRLQIRYPGLIIAGALSPPRGFDAEEDEDRMVVQAVVHARPDLVFVCLGSPRQELWVHQRADRLPPAVYLGLGAAIDFAAGRSARAPLIWQRFGFEWLYRLVHDWERLWKRYLINDVRFIAVGASELWRCWAMGKPPSISSSTVRFEPHQVAPPGSANS